MKIIRESFTFNDILLEPALHSGKSRREIDLTTSSFGKTLSLPIIAAPMDTVVNPEVCKIMEQNGGLGILPRFEGLVEGIAALKQDNLFSVLAIGIISKEELQKQIEQFNPDSILIEVAHAYQKPVLELCKHIVKAYPNIPLTVGNLANAEAVIEFARVGVRSIKIGVGPGANCKTRQVTGCGVPQGVAIYEARKAADTLKSKIEIIADGGIKNSGDIVKALALGADSVMVGSLLASAQETPGKRFFINNEEYKEYRGMASKDVMQNRGIKRAAEGITTSIKVSGSLEDILLELKDGIQSGLSYLGFDSLQELKENRDSIRVRVVMPGSYPETFV
jgi:IMP dehydrogenase/GMP reductase